MPASIYGLALLFLGLFSGLIRLDWVEEAADWLVAIMPITFVPASVALIDDWAILKPFLWPLLLICTVSTVVIFGASGPCHPGPDPAGKEKARQGERRSPPCVSF